jgi:inosine-uridine nucleoside N-ribohydrolase
LKILKISGILNIDVVKGSSASLLGKSICAAHIHGDSGLDGSDLPEAE